MIEAIGGLAFLAVVAAILYKMTAKKETIQQAVNETVQDIKTAETKVEAVVAEVKAAEVAVETEVKAVIEKVKKAKKPRKKKGE